MANQIQATVYQIDGSPLTNSIQIAFLTSNVYMREFQTDLIPAVNSAIVYYPNTNNQLQEQTFLVSETISALISSANSGGTSQISTTVLEINQEPQIPSGLTFSFPVQGISIWPATNLVVGGVNSFIEFKNKKYYLLEDEAALVTAANTGGGGGSTSTGVNGLNGTTSIGLGGTLTGDTTINGNGKDFSIQDTSFFITGSSDDNSQSYLQHTPITTSILTENKLTTEQSQIDIYSNGINTLFNGGVYIGLDLQFAQQKFIFGDYGDTNSHSKLIIDDSSTLIYTETLNGKNGFEISNDYCDFGSKNSTGYLYLQCNLDSQKIATFNQVSSDNGLSLDFSTNNYKFGGYNYDGTFIEIQDVGQIITINCEQELRINGNLIENTTGNVFNDDFLKVTINGSTAYIPLWYAI
jgi:hypothetical protein